ncbi:Rap1a/Tai family immunity protein [Phyllobacterium zundukense]|uniref:Rap1a/Tai family immunity protein n=1 Tax=Phyllobacterium zundukense TaxID=1867719 RepID=UPI003965BFA6
MRILLSVVALGSTLTIAQAETRIFVDGNKLHNFCLSHPLSASGYIIGVADQQLIAEDMNLGQGSKFKFCLPEGAQGGQLVDTVCQYLKNNPQIRHLSGAILVTGSLSEAFPCR